jgi:tyrosine-protein kinase Etk/Wzc
MQGIRNIAGDSKEEEIIILDYIRLIIRNKYWIAIAGLLGLALAYVNLRYTDTIYQSQGSIKIESDDNNNLLKEFSVFKELNSKDKVLTETYIIKSKRLIIQACKKLPVQVSYFSKGRVVNKELYVNTPFVVSFNPSQRESLVFDTPYDVIILDDKTYEISYQGADGDEMKVRGTFKDSVKVGNTYLKLDLVEQNYDFAKKITSNYSFVFNSDQALYSRISANLDVVAADKGVALLYVTYKDIVPEFARDFINALFDEYIRFDIELKSRTAIQTIEFMDRLIDNMETDVQGAEKNMEDFKRNNNLFDLAIKGESSLKILSDLETQKRMYQLQLLSIENLEKQINENRPDASLTLNIDGILDPGLTDLLITLNRLQMERISLRQKVTSQNVASKDIDTQIAGLKQTIKQNISSSRIKISSQLGFINRQLQDVELGMRNLPTQEKEMVELKRDLEVNQKVYGFLLQTKLEAAISQASIVSSARVIDEAEISLVPVSPKRMTTYLMYSFIGVFLCFIVIILYRFFNTKIYTVDEVESASEISVIGAVLTFPQKLQNADSRMLAIKEQHSVFGESIRSVRTNIQFLLPDKKNKIITITSTISGEGKTFSTINLAGSLTMLGKKVIVIGCDLRKPRLESTFINPNNSGLSSYLSGVHSIDEIIVDSDYENLALIFSGPVPPNPAELLHSERMQILLNKLQERFDYILLDTPPVGLVTDAIVLMKMSDIILYVLKAGYSNRSFIELPQKLKDEHHFKNIYILLNSYKVDKLSHKAGYYGYGENDKSGYFVKQEAKSKLARFFKLYR